MEPVIVARGLTKSYGDTAALDHLDLEVAPGQIFGYLGPNGAGKSTTIRLLMGLIRPTSGSAALLGLDVVTQREQVHERVGYLPGDFSAYRNQTGAQYLTFLADVRGLQDRSAITSLAERFALDLDKRIGTLSHGNRQKVGIIQACMHQPPLLVMDEPTAGLDPLMQREFLSLLREHRAAGGTVFLSSHIMTEVEEVADVVAIINNGRLVLQEDVAELATRTRRRLDLTFVDGAEPPIDELRSLGNVHDVTRIDGSVQLVVEGSMAELLRLAAPHGVERVVSNELDLEGVFLQYSQEVGA